MAHRSAITTGLRVPADSMRCGRPAGRRSWARWTRPLPARKQSSCQGHRRPGARRQETSGHRGPLCEPPALKSGGQTEAAGGRKAGPQFFRKHSQGAAPGRRSRRRGGGGCPTGPSPLPQETAKHPVRAAALLGVSGCGEPSRDAPARVSAETPSSSSMRSTSRTRACPGTTMPPSSRT